MTSTRRILPRCAALLCAQLLWLSHAGADVPPTARPFRVTDDIEMTKFLYPEREGHASFSPDGRYFMFVTERGDLGHNCVEDVIWTGATATAAGFLAATGQAVAPALRSLVTVATYCRSSPLVYPGPRWLPDSRHIAFLQLTGDYQRQLWVVDAQTGAKEALTDPHQDVSDYDITGSDVVFEVQSPSVTELAAAARRRRDLVPSVVTGRNLFQLLFPADIDPYVAAPYNSTSPLLWKRVSGKLSPVIDRSSGTPVQYAEDLSLSPDGRFAITRMPVASVPREWETYGDPPGEGVPYSGHIVAGPQKLSDLGFDHRLLVKSYARIDLRSGQVQPLMDAPSRLNEWLTGFAMQVRWSADGKRVVLPSTFLPLGAAKSAVDLEARKRRPCVAVVEVATADASCVMALRGYSEPDHFDLEDARFDSPDGRRITVSIRRQGHERAVSLEQTAAGEWIALREQDPQQRGLDVAIVQSLNDPPKLEVVDTQTGARKVLWDPNPWLRAVALGDASVFRWQDPDGYLWKGVLVKPADYVAGQRYPLVIQTHGVNERRFLTNGLWETAFAARPLASVGFVVLQVERRHELSGTDRDAATHVEGYASAIKALVSAGVVDAQRIGIIGFSVSCYDTLKAMTSADVPIAAASITDGTNMGYWQYLVTADWQNGNHQKTMAQANGADAVGPGLAAWLANAPTFNMDKVSAPLLMAAEGNSSMLYMWEPYAMLRHLHKPVDFIDLGEGSHVLVNPRQILVSQGTNVDWFRFWLQGVEDREPEKAAQYERWERLCEAQRELNPGRRTFCLAPRAPSSRSVD